MKPIRAKEIDPIREKLLDAQLRVAEFAASEAIRDAIAPYEFDIKVEVKYEETTSSTTLRGGNR